MRAWIGFALILCVAVAGCEKDPATSMKIGTRPTGAMAESAAPAPPSATVQPGDAKATSAEKIDAAPPTTIAAAKDTSPVATAPSSSAKTAPAAKDAPGSSRAAGTAPAPPQAGVPPSGTKTAASAKSIPATVVASIPATVAAAPSRKEWRPSACPPPADYATGPSSLKVSGPCAFEHRGTFNCEAAGDDFYLSMTRKAARGSTLMVHINVENYKGPGDYKGAQMFLSVYDKKNIFRWSWDSVNITISPDQAFALLPTTTLPAEPLLVDCSGPMDNYQCAGRGESEELMATAEVAGGKLHCEVPPPMKEKG